jgi:uncharacterized protein (TIRG00374 family)
VNIAAALESPADPPAQAEDLWPIKMKYFNVILLALGCTLLAALIWTVGPAELWNEFTLLGWGLIPFAFCEGAAEMIHTLGWRHCLSGNLRKISWFRLYRIRMAGYAINYLTPTASLGGEVTKTTLLTAQAQVSQAASGVLIGKVCFGLAHLLFVTLGILVVMHTIHLGAAVWIPLLLSAMLVAGGIAIFLLLQKHGKLGAPTRWLVAKGIGGRTVEKIAANFTSVDEELRAFYRDRPMDMCLAICWHLLGYSIGIAQTWFFLHLLHPPVSLVVAAGVWFIGMWFDLLTFAIPLNAGSLEGTRILALKLIGFGAPLGLAYGVALRLAQMLWAGVGLLLYGELTAHKATSPELLEKSERKQPANRTVANPQ